MMQGIQSLGLPLLLQTAVAFLIFILFMKPSTAKGPLKALGLAVLFSVMTMLVEWGLRKYLFEGTLVFLWVMFALLCKQFLDLSLARAAVTMFCVFSLMLGAGMWQERSGRELSEEEYLLFGDLMEQEMEEETESPELPEWAVALRSGVLDRRMTEARGLWVRRVYASRLPEEKESDEPETVGVLPLPPAPVVVEPSAGSMSGEEFEALFARTADRPPSVTPPYPPLSQEESSPVPSDWVEITPTTRPATESVPQAPEPQRRRDTTGGFTGDQLAEVVQVRNRSTDRSFADPQFDVGMVSMGTQGNFAMVDGEMIKEGSIVLNPGGSPRGWRLHRVRSTELLWQPLK